MTIDNSLYLMTNLFMTYTVYHFMRIFFDQRPVNPYRQVLTYGLYFIGVSVVYLLCHQAMLTLATNVLLILLITTSYADSWQNRVTAACFVYIIFLLCEGIVMIAFGIFCTTWFDAFKQQEFILSQLFLQLLAYTVVLLLGHFKITKGHEAMQVRHWLAVIAVPICTVIPMLTLIILESAHHLGLMVLSVASLFAINMIIFYLYDKMAGLYQNRLDWQMMTQQHEAYQQQAELFRRKQEDTQNLHHDLQHHLIALRSYCQDDGNAQVLGYIEHLAETVQWSQKYVQTGLSALDAIVNYKITQAEQERIVMDRSIRVPNRLRVISDDDLCAVLGNLLDNALRAVVDLPPEQRRMSLDISYERNVLSIQVTNSYAGQLRKFQGRLLSTKSDSEQHQHGIGLRSVRKIAEKYGGELKLSDHDAIFIAEIWLADDHWQASQA